MRTEPSTARSSFRGKRRRPAYSCFASGNRKLLALFASFQAATNWDCASSKVSASPEGTWTPLALGQTKSKTISDYLDQVSGRSDRRASLHQTAESPTLSADLLLAGQLTGRAMRAINDT